MIYYWIIVLVYMLNARAAYNFMQQVEEHAYHTYDLFLKEHGEELKQMPAPKVAVNYYLDGDLYMFDEFQTTHPEAKEIFQSPHAENLPAFPESVRATIELQAALIIKEAEKEPARIA